MLQITTTSGQHTADDIFQLPAFKIVLETALPTLFEEIGNETNPGNSAADMKVIVTLLAILGTAITTQAVGVTSIGQPIYNPANGHNYFLVGEGTWSQAETYALTLGGHLVTINDAAENTWLTANFLAPNPTINPWIGLNDNDSNETWTWVSGESVSYLNWAPGEPNFSFERASNIYPADHEWAGQWNNAYDDPSSGVLFGIVEVPEPSTLTLGTISLVALAASRKRRTAGY